MANCPKCGAQLPDGAAFCYKCGSSVTQGAAPTQAAPAAQKQAREVVAPSGATAIKCPNCGAPISPQFGEMLITCEYCGSTVTLGNEGWTNIQRQTMLDLKVASADAVNSIITPMMDKGLLHRHLHEDSVQEEMNLSYVPYWIVSVSARTTVVSINEAAQVGQAATTAVLWGVVLGGMGGGFGGGGGGRRRATELGGILMGNLLNGAYFMRGKTMLFGGMGMGMGYGGGAKRVEQMDANYNFPVVALKALQEYQPHDYQFSLEGRALFDISKVPKGVKVLNGDISEDVARSQAKTLVDQLQSENAHKKYHMIQQITTESDVGDVELLHAPIWFARYDHKGKKIILVVDANSGRVINSFGL
jgi:DNA-directed RNA polymerase subunit RPC12/RpoP